MLMNIRRSLLLVASVFLFSGCQQDTGENALPDKGDNDRFIQVENPSQTDQQNYSNTEIADHLANLASDVPDVNDAVALVAGPYAVVGINVDKDLDRSRVGTIKYSVLESLQHDRYGKTAVVVADGDVTERIRGLSDKVSQGYPVQGIVDELAAIVGRYMPSFPVPEEMPQEPDQNKQVTPEDEQKEIDEIQDEQSNDQMEKKE